jgi:hypothetical protein
MPRAGQGFIVAARRTIHFTMTPTVATFAAEAGVIAGGAPGRSVDGHRGALHGNAQPHGGRERPAEWSQPPPPPTPDALWIPGNWAFDGRANAWNPGHWETPPPNAFARLAA